MRRLHGMVREFLVIDRPEDIEVASAIVRYSGEPVGSRSREIGVYGWWR